MEEMRWRESKHSLESLPNQLPSLSVGGAIQLDRAAHVLCRDNFKS